MLDLAVLFWVVANVVVTTITSGAFAVLIADAYTEAGGVVTDMAGGDDWLLGGTICAGGEALHARILEVLDVHDLAAVTGRAEA